MAYDPRSYDPLSPQVKEDPEAHFAELRQTCPVHHHTLTRAQMDKIGQNPMVTAPTTEMWSLLRYDDVATVLQDNDLFVSREGGGPERMTMLGGDGMLVWADGEPHRRQRRIALRAFSPKTIQHVLPRLQSLIEDVIDDLSGRGEAELMEDFALPVTSGMLTHLLGIPIERRNDVLRWGVDIISTVGGDADVFVRAQQTMMEIADFLAEACPERRAAAARGEERNDAIAYLCTAERDGSRFTDDEIVEATVQFLGAGFESSATAILNGVYVLCTHPEERRKLVENPQLLDGAVEEVLRYMAPIEGVCRTPVDDVEIGGTHIPADSKIRVVFPSANRDESAFTDADRFRIDRPRTELRKQLAFGAGPHTCLGAAIARAELKAAIGTLMHRLPDLELDPRKEPTRNTILLVNGFKTLPVRWNPGNARPRATA